MYELLRNKFKKKIHGLMEMLLNYFRKQFLTVEVQKLVNPNIYQ